MSKYGILFDIDKCVACQACFAACKEENQTAPGMNWVRIDRVEDEKTQTINYFRISCQHCDDPACMKVCPAGAISKGKFGEVLVDQKKCIGCRRCLEACPYGAPLFNDKGVTSYWPGTKPLVERRLEAHQVHEPGKAEHCTLCSHRLARGEKPACVTFCPTGALRLVDLEKPTAEEKAFIEKSHHLTAAAGTNPKVFYRSSRINLEGKSLK